MKNTILAVMLLFALGSGMNVSGQSPTTSTTDQSINAANQRYKYYYYPSTDVYYNAITGDYWYYDTPNSNWRSVKTLPATVTVNDKDRYVLYYNGKDVYKDNSTHKKKYKVKSNGTIKEKSKMD